MNVILMICICQKPQEVIEYTNTGRPKRKSVAKVSYAEVDDDSEEIDFDKLIEEMEKAEAKYVKLFTFSKYGNNSM